MRDSAAFNPSAVVGLLKVGEGAARQTLLAVLVYGQDLYRDVACLQGALELAEHAPAQHVGQEDVERHGNDVILQGKFERLCAMRRDHGFQAGSVGRVDQDPGVAGIILDDQQRAIAGLQVVAIVEKRIGHTLGQNDGRWRRDPRRRLTQGRAWAHVHHRQIEREGAADARHAAQRQLATQ